MPAARLLGHTTKLSAKRRGKGEQESRNLLPTLLEKEFAPHLVEVKHYEDARPGAQLEVSHQQRSEMCKCFPGAEVTLYTILLGVGGAI
eukprot:1150188-Pelagomonas_calceolata.AAC.2